MKFNIFNIIIFYITVFRVNCKDLTASSETLLWKRLNHKTIDGVGSIEEAFILVPVDYEDKNSPLILINIRKYSKKGSHEGNVNVWYVPGGPGQSSKTLELILPGFVSYLPEGATVYAIDHRGLGKSTPLANENEKRLLESYPSDPSLLPKILLSKQEKLGIMTPLTRALRVENVARDLLKSVELVQMAQQGSEGNRNYLIGVSYGTMICRRALQLAPRGSFESVILDGLAPVERIEKSNESDQIIQEMCDEIPECKSRLEAILSENNIPQQLPVRQIIPLILKNNSKATNSCASIFLDYLQSQSLCSAVHELMNSSLLQGRTSVKVASMRVLFELAYCSDPEGFSSLYSVIHKALMQSRPVNQLQGVAVAAVASKQKKDSLTVSSALSSDELVFEVVSALERYDVTEHSLGICYSQEHVEKGDEEGKCPARLFDPCRFFQLTFDRKESLLKAHGSLPPISLQSPFVDANDTRLIVLSGNFDFNTPTWLSRDLTNRFLHSEDLRYHEFFGFGHAMFGSSDCDMEIFSDFLHGTSLTADCVSRWNLNYKHKVNEYFSMSLADLDMNVFFLIFMLYHAVNSSLFDESSSAEYLSRIEDVKVEDLGDTSMPKNSEHFCLIHIDFSVIPFCSYLFSIERDSRNISKHLKFSDLVEYFDYSSQSDMVVFMLLKNLYIMRLSTRKVIREIKEINCSKLAISNDGYKIACLNIEGRFLSFIDSSTESDPKTVFKSDYIHDFRFSPDSSTLWVISSMKGQGKMLREIPFSAPKNIIEKSTIAGPRSALFKIHPLGDGYIILMSKSMIFVNFVNREIISVPFSKPDSDLIIIGWSDDYRFAYLNRPSDLDGPVLKILDTTDMAISDVLDSNGEHIKTAKYPNRVSK